MKKEEKKEIPDFIKELSMNYESAVQHLNSINTEELEKIRTIQNIGYNFIESKAIKNKVTSVIIEASKRGIKDIRFYYCPEQEGIVIEPLDFDNNQERLISFGIFDNELLDFIQYPEALISQIKSLRSKKDIQQRLELLIDRLHEIIKSLGLVDTKRSFYTDPRDPFFVGRKGGPKLEFCVAFEISR
jgi:hypothetical protein